MKTQKNPVLAALVHELVKVERFETLSDLSEATKVAAARLKIPYGPTSISEALALVARTRPLVSR
jgi:hypothetical protein